MLFNRQEGDMTEMNPRQGKVYKIALESEPPLNFFFSVKFIQEVGKENFFFPIVPGSQVG